MSLDRLDLNLLVVFDVLMRELNVSKAASSLFIGQSAMSHTLNRLRQALDDPILVKMAPYINAYTASTSTFTEQYNGS